MPRHLLIVLLLIHRLDGNVVGLEAVETFLILTRKRAMNVIKTVPQSIYLRVKTTLFVISNFQIFRQS
jgi:hypothetical protein